LGTGTALFRSGSGSGTGTGRALEVALAQAQVLVQEKELCGERVLVIQQVRDQAVSLPQLYQTKVSREGLDGEEEGTAKISVDVDDVMSPMSGWRAPAVTRLLMKQLSEKQGAGSSIPKWFTAGL